MYDIPDGEAGINAIVHAMWELVNQDYTHIDINNIAKTLRGNTNYETIKNTFNYVVDNYKYKSDPPDREHLSAPRHIVNKRNKYQDCDELVILLCALLKANSIPCAMMTIAWRVDEYTHVVALASYNSSWVILDPTKGRSGFGGTVEPIASNPEFWKLKNYGDPMGKMAVLNDCGCRNGSGKAKSDANNININIGNSQYDYDNLTGGGGNKRIEVPKPYPVQLPGKTEYITVEKNIPKKIYLSVPLKYATAPGIVTYREFY